MLGDQLEETLKMRGLLVSGAKNDLSASTSCGSEAVMFTSTMRSPLKPKLKCRCV